ncbi:MAG TPA: hypothetical protein PK264_15935 [Hyphomicrobiaceae bacterium]|nr:hypothetical protein [Hyphomicrobiaceae bacterium]
MLVQYADGELDEAKRREIEAYLASDPKAAELVNRLQKSAALLKQAFEVPASSPVPDRLIAVLQESPAARPGVVDAEHTTTITPIGRRRLSQRGMFLPMAMAASLALVVGAGVGFGLRDFRSPSISTVIAAGPVASGSALARLLHSRTTGEGEQIGAGARRIEVVGTFRDRTGRPCREIEQLDGKDTSTAPELAAIACADGAGGWVVEGVVRVAASATPDGKFRPSGADEKDALKALLIALGAGAAVSPSEERGLIQRSWK